jgi:hypothetical protein
MLLGIRYASTTLRDVLEIAESDSWPSAIVGNLIPLSMSLPATQTSTTSS